MVFILFDVEAIFLYPWASSSRMWQAIGTLGRLVSPNCFFVSVWLLSDLAVERRAFDWNKKQK